LKVCPKRASMLSKSLQRLRARLDYLLTVSSAMRD
jgi:hypothetical protein